MTQLLKATQLQVEDLIIRRVAYSAAMAQLTQDRSKLKPRSDNYDAEWMNFSQRITEIEHELAVIDRKIDKLEAAEMERCTIHVISKTKTTAQVVVKTTVNGECVSQTRHLQLGKDGYTGRSLFGHRFAKYTLDAKAPATPAPIALPEAA